MRLRNREDTHADELSYKLPLAEDHLVWLKDFMLSEEPESTKSNGWDCSVFLSHMNPFKQCISFLTDFAITHMPQN